MAKQPKTAITDVKQTTSMHPVHRPSSFTLRLVGALLAGLCHAGPLAADTYTWDGSASGLWGTTANWSGILNLPLTDDEAVFPAAGSNKSMSNNLGSGLAINRLTFSSAGYTLNGSGISLSSTVGVPLLRATHLRQKGTRRATPARTASNTPSSDRAPPPISDPPQVRQGATIRPPRAL